jgi:hypothetical protein
MLGISTPVRARAHAARVTGYYLDPGWGDIRVNKGITANGKPAIAGHGARIAKMPFEDQSGRRLPDESRATQGALPIPRRAVDGAEDRGRPCPYREGAAAPVALLLGQSVHQISWRFPARADRLVLTHGSRWCVCGVVGYPPRWPAYEEMISGTTIHTGASCRSATRRGLGPSFRSRLQYISIKYSERLAVLRRARIRPAGMGGLVQ